MAKSKIEKLCDEYHFLEPELADKMIRERIDKARPDGRVKGDGQSLTTWKPIELEVRNQVILDLYRQGLSDRRVREEIMNRWGVKPQTAKKYIEAALDTLIEDREQYIQYNRQKAEERMLGIMEECLEKGNYRDALKASDQLHKVQGIYTENQNVQIEGDLTFEFGTEK